MASHHAGGRWQSKKGGTIAPKYSPSLPFPPLEPLKVSPRNSPTQAVQVENFRLKEPWKPPQGGQINYKGKEATNVRMARPSPNHSTSGSLPSQGPGVPLIREQAELLGGRSALTYRTPSEDDSMTLMHSLLPTLWQWGFSGNKSTSGQQDRACLYPRLNDKERISYNIYSRCTFEMGKN